MHFAVTLTPCILAFLLSFLQVRADFENDVLDEHNKFRAKHGCPNLKLDASLNEDCKKYAQELAASGTLKHSQGPYGENLCYTTDDPVTCVKNWYDEIKDYNFDKAQFSSGTGHFTQLVWKASNTLGAGTHKSADGINFVVARYKPAGNMEGEFKENVPRANAQTQYPSKYLILLSGIFLMLLSKGYVHLEFLNTIRYILENESGKHKICFNVS